MISRILITFKYFFAILLIIGLLFSSGVFSILLYAKLTTKERMLFVSSPLTSVQSENQDLQSDVQSFQTPQSQRNKKKRSIILKAPLVKQKPELPNGCEITALAMLLQFYGIAKDKMDLLPEIKKDPASLKTDLKGNIIFWGNPNNGFVGDITGKGKGYGIYSGALFHLLHKYIPTGIDLTGRPFEELEKKVSDGIPVLVWTTTTFTVPKQNQWLTWDSPSGPVRATMLEHTVLLVGYDEQHVYVNDPLSGRQKVRIEKQQFIETWQIMGKQALSYD